MLVRAESRRKTLKWKPLLVALVAALAFAAPGSAQNLDLSELAALLVTPIVVGGHGAAKTSTLNRDEVIRTRGAAVTLATITNAKSSPVLLKVDLVAGDSTWVSTSFECELTGRETTTFVFAARDGGPTAVYVECSDGSDTEGDPQVFFTGFDNGMMVVAVGDPNSGATISQNALFGDAVVVDIENGQAYSMGAIPFQAGAGQNDGDKVYAFDGQEYAKFPAVLATNVLLPNDRLNAELILFTLDGTTGSNPTPRSKLGGYAYNDDEEAVDFQHEFDCFDIVTLDTINPNIRNGAVGLGTLSGHLELVAQPTATANDSHDDQYGDGNDTRTRPVHGWIVQNVGAGNNVLIPVGQPIPSQMDFINVAGGAAAWARPLGQGRLPAVPFAGDADATLDADVLN